MGLHASPPQSPHSPPLIPHTQSPKSAGARIRSFFGRESHPISHTMSSPNLLDLPNTKDDKGKKSKDKGKDKSHKVKGMLHSIQMALC